MRTKTVLIAIGLLIANCTMPTIVSAQQLYGMTALGGANNYGALFIYNPADSAYTKKIDFYSIGAYNPTSLMQASDGNLYGMTAYGGANDSGVIFQYNPVTSICTKILDFAGAANGSYPFGGLMQASDGYLYGMTSRGGANHKGVLFQFSLATFTCTKKIDFDSINGAKPLGSLMQASDGNLYGMTQDGGANNKGVLFQFNPSTSVCTKEVDFAGATNGQFPFGSLIEASDGNLYGMTPDGGVNYGGVIFQFNLTNFTYTKKFDFKIATGVDPTGSSLIQASDGNLYGVTVDGGVNNVGVIFQFNLTDSTYTKKYDFAPATGSEPFSPLMQASDGNLYGMTYYGGGNGQGVLFQYNPVTATYTKKLDFAGTANGGYAEYNNLIEIAATINTSSLTTNNCVGSNISVPYTITGIYNAGNVFTAQLSNANGSFASPDTIGGDTTTTSGTIEATIPSNTPVGAGYRIRVVSSNPAETGSDNGSNLAINAQQADTVAVTLCAGDSLVIDSHTYTTSGTFTDTLTAIAGCDSIVTTNLTIRSIITDSLAVTLCGGDSLIVGTNTYKSSGNYTDTLTAVSGCDSTVTTLLTVNPPVDITDSVNGVTITSNAIAATYQWINCANENSILATNQSYIASADGNYAVIVTVNGCSDTSACVNISISGMDAVFSNYIINFSPNPATNQLTIHTSSFHNEAVMVSVVDVLGQIASPPAPLQGERGADATIYIGNLPAGMYFVEMKTESGSVVKRFVKE